MFRQSFGGVEELITLKSELADPLSEEHDSPVEGITHRYPDRVLFHVSNICSMYCRHCTRKRKVGDVDFVPTKAQLSKGIEYIRKTPQVRDVLLSGGDPFMLSDEMIDWLLSEISSIEHVELIRIGTRMPVVLPYRITDELISILKKYQPVWINTHFNHPRELTPDSAVACALLADSGIVLGNQTVLLRGVNDDAATMTNLLRGLLKIRVRPYYLHQMDLVQGTTHFRTPLQSGLDIIRALRGPVSGMACPHFVVDLPGGKGKAPLLPDGLSYRHSKTVITTSTGEQVEYSDLE